MSHRFPYLEGPTPLAFAHRGGTMGGRENTMAAFARAVDLGYRYVETDVRATSDGVLVAVHDPTLDRVTDRTGAIADLPWAEVRQARVAGIDPIPLAEDLLAAWPDVRINIDPKEMAALEPLERAIRRTNTYDRVCIGSFSDRRLRLARAALGPRVCSSLGPRAVAALRLSAWLGGRGGRPGPVPCVQVPTRYNGIPVADRSFIHRAHSRGLQVHVWTVNDRPEMERLLDLGVDGIMTDELETLRDVYQERGLWTK